MQQLNDVQLRRLDLTLLIVFDEAIRSRRFGLVARKLGLTPSAISHAMVRLRDIFGDPLFQRRGNAVVPTPKAMSIAVPIRRVLDELRGVIGEGVTIDPARLERTFHIAALDYAITVLLPGALASFASTAPRTRFALVSLGRSDAIRGLDDGRLDLAIGVFAKVPDGFRSVPLSQERFVVTCRRDHPVVSKQLNLDRFLALDHLLVSAAGDFEGAVDVALGRMGLKRRVVAALPQFLAALATVAGSDAAVTVPEGVARRYADRFGLAVLPPPLELPGFEVVALSGPASAFDPAIAWLTDGLVHVARDAATPGTGSENHVRD
jgi:DNA-binding transcriptional LysR family regulator